MLKGKILADSIEAPIHIINITAEKGTVTEASGEFSVEVSENDLLLFSSVQFQKKEILITSEILSSGLLEIELHKDLTELDEVRLHQLSGNLANDIDDIKTFDPRIIGFALSDKEPLSIEERKLAAMSSPMDPVGLIYGAISGENKKLKKAIENNRLSTLVYKAREFVPDEYFTETLFLPENKIMDFLYYCSLKPNFKELVNKNDPLVLMEFLKEMVPKYNEFIEE
ncbi:carboxypeptidase-like regulatory domain-containing protein [Salegentibacter sp. LM13S]|uniref:carboxypeptidase-like regulatory domain-containing protein n=1 Tax=Salegentibacter lacus TaxID=2873599 RepID=UPI001CCBE96E|nr:carboxypeptidase-like regulatory domain-containing protein [Salegentibacter lacus]MBZ9630714.1 carboxypeptidase-like regulatory domain-containing protein [Salegentibacter lacus]